MHQVKGYAAQNAETPLGPFSFARREVGSNDVQIELNYCGVCHSDLHQARNEWGNSIYPMVPGHEMIGTVSGVGRDVSRFKKGDRVGVGCFVDSCRTCGNCKDGEEQYCDNGTIFSYNGYEKDQKTPTYGGYSSQTVVDQNYVLKIPPQLDPAAAAPLLCAGITTFSPLHKFKLSKGQKLGVVGLGGLGHMAVKLGVAMGAEVTVLSTSKKKADDAKRLGAHDFVVTGGDASALGSRFDLMINTVSARTDLNMFCSMLKRDGTMVLVGVPPEQPTLNAHVLVMRRRRIAGSLIGGIRETQEMLNFCAEHGVVADIETIAMKDINTAYERMLKGDVHYRFVIDLKTLSA